MCDHCGCRQLTPVARFMDEHDQLRDRTGRIRGRFAGGDDAQARTDVAELHAGLFVAVDDLAGSDWDDMDRWEEIGTLDLSQQGR